MARKSEGRIIEVGVQKVVKSQATDNGKWAVLVVEDNNDRTVGVFIPAEQSHSAALALFVAADAAYEKQGIVEKPIFKTAKIGFGRHLESQNELFVQVLYPQKGGSLAFAYDGAAARKLHAELHEFLYGDASLDVLSVRH